MVFIVVELAASAIILWAYDRSRLEVLGFLPKKSRVVDFVFGFLTSALLCGACLLMIAFLAGTSLSRNTDFTLVNFLKSTYWMFRSVLTEELLFRGALLVIAIKKLGLRNACLVSAVAFGIYHWFSFEVFGSIRQMIYVFILTAVGGFLFAYSFAATKSLYLPVGLHLGWNLVNVVVFSEGPLGQQFLVADGGQPLNAAWSIAFFLYQITILPFAVFLYLRRQEGIRFNA
jgi:membrane protease YdiL (CAAX protease family)